MIEIEPAVVEEKPTRVKICGITRFEDAELVAGMGAWALGMIFYKPSPRNCDPEIATSIARRFNRKLEVCGVFVNERLERIVRVADTVGLTVIQLHGDEGPQFANTVARRTGCKVIKALRVHDRADIRGAASFSSDYCLLDTYSKQSPELRGGSGETFNWDLLDAYPSAKTPLILSGGLNPNNVAEAIASCNPFAVDVASGVEAYPGVKDQRLLGQFFDAVTGVQV